jgi:alkylated DNA repair protein (DNA oxidative demethylase)
MMEADQTNSGALCVHVTLPVAPVEQLAAGAMLLRGFAAAEAAAIVQRIERMGQSTPFRHMVTPGGYRMSVAMLNCGTVGWVTDHRGYRYEPIDPESGFPWPAMPPLFRQFAERAATQAGFANFQPDCCLVNRYEPGAKLSLHQDKDEATYDAPIVSVSLGLPATFLFGGLRRKVRPRRLVLENGDVVVWGGPARLAYHGVDTLADGEHPLTGRCRFTLTFRKALA